MIDATQPQRQRTILPETHWAQMRADYEAGFSAREVAEYYGATQAAVEKRAYRHKWRKLVSRALPPMRACAEVGEGGGDAQQRWEAIAHDAQRAPEGAWSTWLFQGGRGAGKTRAGAEWLAARAEATPNGRFALVGPTQHDVREVMIDGVSGLRNLPGREPPRYETARRRLRWKNGALAFAFSAEEPERLRGPQFEAAWADEFCIWPKPAQTLANLRLALRRGAHPQLVITTTPKPIAAMRALRAEPGCVITQAATSVNAAHLAPTFLSGLDLLYGGTRLAAQELEGLLVDGDGALFRAEDLARARGCAPAQFDTVVVGVDPPAGAGGAACGIVAAGRLGERFFVLEDATVAGLSPLGWAARVCETARRHGAGSIVAEANQGGEMVRATLALAGAPCAIRLAHARHGKRARAEPVSAIYEQGRVVHCGAFAALEEELMALGVSEHEGLLDRADALVWALTALMKAGDGPRVRML